MGRAQVHAPGGMEGVHIPCIASMHSISRMGTATCIVGDSFACFMLPDVHFHKSVATHPLKK